MAAAFGEQRLHLSNHFPSDALPLAWRTDGQVVEMSTLAIVPSHCRGDEFGTEVADEKQLRLNLELPLDVCLCHRMRLPVNESCALPKAENSGAI